jgi:hypothetical protein
MQMKDGRTVYLLQCWLLWECLIEPRQQPRGSSQASIDGAQLDVRADASAMHAYNTNKHEETMYMSKTSISEA